MAGEKKVASLYAELVLKNELPDQLSRARKDLRNFTTGPLSDLEKSAGKTGQSLSGMTDGLDGAMKRGIGGVKALGAELLALGGITTAAFGAAAVAKAAIGFEKQMFNIRAVTGDTASETEALKNELVKLGAASRQGPSQIANAYYDIAGGMTDVTARMPTLKAALDTADAGAADLAGTTQALITLLNSYGTANITAAQASDVLTRTVGMGVGTMDQFASAMAPIAGMMAQAGVKAQDLGSMLAYMTTKGMSASMSANSIQQAVVAMLNPNEKLRKILPQVLTEYEKINGKLQATKKLTMSQALEQYGLVGVLQRVQQAAGGGKDALVQMLGSVEASRAAFALLGADYAGFNQQYITGLKGATEQAKQIQNKSTQAQLELLGSKLEAIAIKIGDLLLPIANAALSVFNGILDAAVGAFEGVGKAINSLLPKPQEKTADQKAANAKVASEGLGAIAKDDKTFQGYMSQVEPLSIEVKASDSLMQVLNKKIAPDDMLTRLASQGIFPDMTLQSMIDSGLMPATTLDALIKDGVDVRGSDTLAHFVTNTIPVDPRALTILNSGLMVSEVEIMKLNQAVGMKPELHAILTSGVGYNEKLAQLKELGLKPDEKLTKLAETGVIESESLKLLAQSYGLLPSASLKDLAYVSGIKGTDALMQLTVPLNPTAQATIAAGINVNKPSWWDAAANEQKRIADIANNMTNKRAGGGPVAPGTRYQVNETGKPEVYESGGKQFLIPSTRGNVIPMSAFQGGGSVSIAQVNISGVNDPVRIWDEIQAEARRRNVRIG